MNDPNRATLGAGMNPPSQTQRPRSRVLDFFRAATTKAVWVFVILAFGYVTLPEGSRPSDLYGAIHGAIEKWETIIKGPTMIEFERQKARAIAREQGKVQWEMEVLRRQMQTLSDGMRAQTEIANTADWVCIAGRVFSGLATNPDWRNAGQTMTGACGYSAQVRAAQQQEYAELARKYAALVARNDELSGQLRQFQ